MTKIPLLRLLVETPEDRSKVRGQELDSWTFVQRTEARPGAPSPTPSPPSPTPSPPSWAEDGGHTQQSVSGLQGSVVLNKQQVTVEGD